MPLSPHLLGVLNFRLLMAVLLSLLELLDLREHVMEENSSEVALKDRSSDDRVLFR